MTNTVNNLQKRRKELGLSQEEVARKANISYNTYVSYERRGVQPSIGRAFHIARILKEDAANLFCLDC